ncbi:MAG: hypothetical protein GXC73_18770 [Chitinophagaceae bacterium]|nr:hypothetical protein [Chitinophagaceae bacterium]
MKKTFFIMLLISSFITAHKANAQVNVNIGLQPAWGPAGYQYVDYYYLPDIETYYYVPTKQFVYLNNGRWVYSAGLPSRYRTYNLYNGYKVVVNQPKPYLHHSTYKVKYAKYKGSSGKQAALKNSKVKVNNGGNGKGAVVKGKPAGGKGGGKGKNKHL